MIEAKKENGRWLVDGNKPNTLNPAECKIFDALIIKARLKCSSVETESKPFPNWEAILTDKN